MKKPWPWPHGISGTSRSTSMPFSPPLPGKSPFLLKNPGQKPHPLCSCPDRCSHNFCSSSSPSWFASFLLGPEVSPSEMKSPSVFLPGAAASSAGALVRSPLRSSYSCCAGNNRLDFDLKDDFLAYDVTFASDLPGQ